MKIDLLNSLERLLRFIVSLSTHNNYYIVYEKVANYPLLYL